MSSTQSKAAGLFNETAGKVKQAFGEATGNESLANEGAAQQVKGHAQQAMGSLQDGVHNAVADFKERRQPEMEKHAANLRDSITETTSNLKDKIQQGVDDFKKEHLQKTA